MKNNISKSLSQSLLKERSHIKTLNFDRFEVADKVLSKNNNPAKQTKVIRDTFTIPEDDYVLINNCRNRLLKQEVSVTKSEVIRIALKVLQNMSDLEIKHSYNLIEKIKIGRPKKT